jgi:hypothetical protein
MGDSVVMIGTDDGEQFWVKRGQLHRGAPGVAQLSLGNSTGTFNQHGVVWQDDHRRDGGGGGATWTRFTDGLNLSNVGDGSQQQQQQLVGFTALTYSEYIPSYIISCHRIWLITIASCWSVVNFGFCRLGCTATPITGTPRTRTLPRDCGWSRRCQITM